MLIINNGTPKSGSTWVNKILNEMLAPKTPPKEWIREDWQSASIHPKRLAEYVATDDFKDHPVLIKAHMPYRKKLDYLLRSDIRIIVTHRYLPDSVLSLFHHQVRWEKTDPEKKERWLRTKGIEAAKFFRRYRRDWMQHDDVLMIPYEEMVAEAPKHIARIATHMGIELSPERLNEIGEATQVRLKPGEAPRDGNHSRTGGISRAREEIPEQVYDRLVRMDQFKHPSELK